MRISLRTSLIAVLAAALVTSVPLISSTGAQAAPVVSKNSSPYSRVQATKILAQVQAAMAPKKQVPRKLGDPLPRKDLGLLLHQLQVAKPAMTAKQQSIVDSFGRPVPISSGCTDYTPFLQAIWKATQSAHFCIHYRESGAGAATAQQVQRTIDTMEFVFAEEVTSLGYRAPLDDGDHKYDVFLDQIGDQGYYGFCTTDTGASTSSAWCGLDNDFSVNEFGAPPLNSLRVTAAHEFFHAVQFAYDANDSTWFLEGTAVWMEDQVYPSINDYLQYLPNSQIVQPDVPIDTAGDFERYGAVTFWKYLSEAYNSINIIHRIWYSAATSSGSRNGIAAAVAVLKSEGHTFGPAFARYAVWNTLPPGTYDDRNLFPKPAWSGVANLTTKDRDTGSQTITLNHLSNAPVVVLPSSGLKAGSKVQITVDAPSYGVGQARIQVRKTDGSVDFITMALTSTGYGTKTVPFGSGSVASVVVTLSNVNTTANNQKFLFRAKAILP